MINDLCRQQPPPLARPPRAFTILELLISTAVITIVVIGVGYIFQSSSTAAGTSQALLEQMGDARAIQRLLRKDLAGIDKRSFLIIRSRMLDPSNAASPRFDQIAFIAYGSFPNRTGAADVEHPFFDQTIANAAHIWWGHLVMQKQDPPDNSYARTLQGLDHNNWDMPTGTVWQDGRWTLKEEECVLGRHATLMLPGPMREDDIIVPAGRPLKAYQGISSNTNLIRGSALSSEAAIWSSRFAVAAISPEQVRFHPGQREDYCYRFRALDSIYDASGGPNLFVDGYFRMHPIVARGVSSLKIDWTDGSTDEEGQLVWFGPTHFKGNDEIEQINPDLSLKDDQYSAFFHGSRPDLWPAALRFSYHAVDPQHRLPGGRDYVEIISLPD